MKCFHNASPGGAGPLLATALLAAAIGVLGQRGLAAYDTCRWAQTNHRLIGPFLQCVAADTVLQEDDDR
jgi:hypothetical protein